MGVWHFATDAESDAFCRRIAASMVARFGCSEADAIALINRFWRRKDFLGRDDRHQRYHWPVYFWSEYIHSFVRELIRKFGP